MADTNLRALTALHRLRRVETDDARRDLGDALSDETAAAARHAAAVGELEAALRITGDFDRETFSSWLQRTREERAELAIALQDAETRTAATRTALAHRRVAETAAEEAVARGLAARQAEVARREQLTLEDVSRALRRAAAGRETD